MHEELLGYLLGALEPHEMRRVDALIQSDPDLRRQLVELERALEPLERGCETPVDPVPFDLVARTMNSIPPLSGKDTSAGKSQATFDSLVPMHPEVQLAEPNQWSLIDWVGGAVAAAILLGLMIPSLAEGRFEARKAACQNQLRQIGTALTQFVIRDRNQRLPAVAESGPEAFAGVYAVRLHDAGLLPEPTARWCPSRETPQSDAVTLTPIGTVDTISDLHEADVDTLREIQRYSGGHYAYTLGVQDGHRLKPPRFESRASFAVMSDAPPAGFSGRSDMLRLTGHGGQGINVLFEDGRVQFLAIPTVNSLPDHPLLNNRNRTEAGVHIDDASLAPSWVAPFIDAVQR